MRTLYLEQRVRVRRKSLQAEKLVIDDSVGGQLHPNLVVAIGHREIF